MDTISSEYNAERAISQTIVGSPAPNFFARSTSGDIQLSDYAGEWLLLFFHPADFTPVCTSEFVSLAQRKQEFNKMNVKLLGLSVDSIFSH